MTDEIKWFYHFFWGSLIITLAMGLWLFVVVRHRHVWLSWTAAEAAFWTRLRFPKRLVCACRRFGETRAFKWVLWVETILWLLCGLLCGAGYLYFNRPTLLFYSGRHEYRSGEYKEAIADLDRAIELNPRFAFAYCFRGAAKTEIQDYSGAVADCTKAVELNPKYWAAYAARGFAKICAGNNVGAIADYGKAIELHPKYAIAYNYRGLARSHLKDYRGAIADFTKVIELNSKIATAVNNGGEERLRVVDKYQHPDVLARAYNYRGNARRCLEDYSGAIADYSKAVEIWPDYKEATTNWIRAEKEATFGN